MMHSPKRKGKSLPENGLCTMSSSGIAVLACLSSQRDTWKYFLFLIHSFIFTSEIITYMEIWKWDSIFSNKQVEKC